MKKYDVKVISTMGDTVLVEWDDGIPQRGYLPLEAVQGEQVEAETLDMAAPYGVPWDKLLDPGKGFGKVFAAELRKAGIWTAADARKNGKVIQSVTAKLLGLSLGGVYKRLNEYLRATGAQKE